MSDTLTTADVPASANPQQAPEAPAEAPAADPTAPVIETESGEVLPNMDLMYTPDPPEAPPAIQDPHAPEAPTGLSDAAGENPATDAAAPAAAEASDAEAPDAPTPAERFLEASRADKAARQARQEAEAASQAYNQQVAEYHARLENIKTNPLEALEKEGISYEDLTKQVLQEGGTREDAERRALQRKVQELEGRLEQVSHTYAQAQAAQAVAGFKQQLAGELSGDYPALNAMYDGNPQEAVETLYAIVDQHYNTSGVVLSPSEAAEGLETHLRGQYETMSKVLGAPSSPTSQQPPAERPVSPKPVSATLSNSATTPNHAQPVDYSQMTEEEALELDAKLIQWEPEN